MRSLPFPSRPIPNRNRRRRFQPSPSNVVPITSPFASLQAGLSHPPVTPIPRVATSLSEVLAASLAFSAGSTYLVTGMRGRPTNSQMNESPNHALQRTATGCHGSCFSRSGVFPSSRISTSLGVLSASHHRSYRASPPRSLSLGSLGVAASHHTMTPQSSSPSVAPERERVGAGWLLVAGWPESAAGSGTAESSVAQPFVSRGRGRMPNKITGANAGGPRQLPIRTRWAARVAQFGR